MSAGEKRLFRSVTQTLQWLHFRLLFIFCLIRKWN